MFDNGRFEKMGNIPEIMKCIKIFNTNIEKVLYISDKYITFALLSESVEADISAKLNDYIHNKR